MGARQRVGGNFHEIYWRMWLRTTLRDHLIGQVNIDFDDPIEAIITNKLIDMLDDNGWLLVCRRLRVMLHGVLKTLSRCQELDPPGIFGRTLAES